MKTKEKKKLLRQQMQKRRKKIKHILFELLKTPNAKKKIKNNNIHNI